MTMIKDPVNRNYCGTVVSINQVVDIPKRDRIHHAVIFGSRVIVGKDVKVGDIGVYFPVETQLSHELVSNINGYRHREWGNVQQDAKEGFFEQNRRIKCLRFSGAESQGMYLPLSSFAFTGADLSELVVGKDFDELNGVPICCKYRRERSRSAGSMGQSRKKHVEDLIVDNQFRRHYDTGNLRRNWHQISPSDVIDISVKCHGTSVIFANLLIQRELPWYERILQRLGVQIKTESYGHIWSSRKVVKGINGESKDGAVHYYSEDVWGQVAKRVEHLIPKGFTVYGEIVGYTADGAAIQKMGGNAYDYGCAAKECKLYVYRVTQTNVDGHVIELTAPQVREWCASVGLDPVPPIYYGRADGLVGYQVGDVSDWQKALIDYMEEYWVRDQDSALCINQVPEEGIVVRRDGLNVCDGWKLKSFKFLSGETDNLDKDVVDIEEEQCVEVPE